MFKKTLPPMAAYQRGRRQSALPLLYRALQGDNQPFGVLRAVPEAAEFYLAQSLMRYVDRLCQFREGNAAGETDGSEGGYRDHLLCFYYS